MIDLELVKENKPVELKLEGNSKGGTNNYNELDNKPTINGKTLQGNLTLEDLGIILNAVKDILINGASIIDENGNANIPRMSADGFGVAKIWNAFGINIHENGHLMIEKANTTDMNTRDANYKSIVPSNFGYMLKRAMSDGIDAEWTQEEKANARKRMGIDTWEVLADMTLTEDVNSIVVDTDSNGNPFQVRKMRMTFIGDVSHARLNLLSNTTNNVATRNMQNTYFYQAFKVGASETTVIEIGEKMNNGLCAVTCNVISESMTSSYVLATYEWKTMSAREKEYLDRIEMRIGATDGYFKAGMRVVVEGVR